MPSTRRRFLASSLGAAALATAGCVGDTPGTDADSPTDSGTEPKGSPAGTETPPPASARRSVGGAKVAVTRIVGRKAITYESIMGSGGVVAPEGGQFVVASVHSETDLTMDEFAFRAGGQSWNAVDPGERGAQTYAVAGHEGGVVGSPELGGSDAARYVAFEVASPLEADDPRITLQHRDGSAAWTLPEDARETLAASAPSFALDGVDAPDSVDRGDSLDVELTATNSSGTAGRFLAALYWPTRIADDDESHVVERPVGAGETVTASLSIDTEYTATEDGTATLGVAGHVSAEREITVVGGTSTA